MNTNLTIEEFFTEIKAQTDIFEKARLLEFLRRKREVPLREISQRIGIKPSYLCHIIRLCKLPALIIDGHYSKLISISHLFIISRLLNENQMIEVYEKVLGENLSVNTTENLVREILHGVKNEGNYLTKEKVEDFVNLVKKRDSYNTQITQTRTRGRLIFELKGSPLKTTPALSGLMKAIQSWLSADSSHSDS